jgi:hypothetical protein
MKPEAEVRRVAVNFITVVRKVKNRGVRRPFKADTTSDTPVPLVRGSRITRAELTRISREEIPANTAKVNHSDADSTEVIASNLQLNKT